MSLGNNWQPRDAEVARLKDRVLSGETAIMARIDGLQVQAETRWRGIEENAAEWKTRRWQVALAIVTGLVLPLAVLGVLALVHLVAR